MTDKHSEDVDQLVDKFQSLVEQSNEIRKQMKELAKKIEAHTGRPMGVKSSHEIDIPKKRSNQPNEKAGDDRHE